MLYAFLLTNTMCIAHIDKENKADGHWERIRPENMYIYLYMDVYSKKVTIIKIERTLIWCEERKKKLTLHYYKE